MNKFPSTAEGCHALVKADPNCDDNNFSWANGNDNNCWCVKKGYPSQFKNIGKCTMYTNCPATGILFMFQVSP